MNDLATLAARPRPLVVDGVQYMIFPLTIADFGQLQAWVDAQQPDPITIAQGRMDEFPLAQQKLLLATALELASRPRPRIGSPEADALVCSIGGTTELLYLSIRKGDPNFTRARADKLVAGLKPTDLARILRDTDADKLLSDPPTGETAQ